MAGAQTIEELVDPIRLGDYLNTRLDGGAETTVEAHVAGFSNVTCFVTRGGVEYVLRRPPAGPLLPTAHDVAREHRFLAALHDTAARVARPVLLCEDNSIIGAPFYLMERKYGHVIRNEMPEVLDNASDRHRIGFEMIDALAEIHSVDWRAAGLRGRDGSYLERQLTRWKHQADLSVGKVRELPTLDEVGLWLHTNRPTEEDVTVVHGDFKLDNVMFAATGPARVIAVFDWEMATIGDPLADLGWLMHTWGRPDGPTEDDAAPVSALPGFATRSELAERYAAVTGRRMDRFDWYHVLALWKLAIILEGLYVGYKTGTATNPASDAFEQRVLTLIERARYLIAQSRNG